MIGIERQDVEALAVRVDRPRAGEQPRGVVHPEAAEGWRLHPVCRQIGLVDGLGLQAGGASVCRGPCNVGASSRGETGCP